jgi:hypothetical protein
MTTADQRTIGLWEESYQAARAEYRLSGPMWDMTVTYPGGGSIYLFFDLARAEACARLLQEGGATVEISRHPTLEK